MKFAVLTLVFGAIALAGPTDGHADGSGKGLQGRYFMVVRGYQAPDNDVVKAHTFVSFYRGEQLRSQNNPPTISWLPSSGVVHIFGSERGRNFSLAQTMAMAHQTGREVKSWGPYEI